MRRTSIYLTEEQRAQLDARALAQGISRAELVRNMLDRTIRGDADRLAADLAAITDSSERWRTTRPSWTGATAPAVPIWST
jgi:hypothetical protein